MLKLIKSYLRGGVKFVQEGEKTDTNQPKISEEPAINCKSPSALAGFPLNTQMLAVFWLLTLQYSSGGLKSLVPIGSQDREGHH